MSQVLHITDQNYEAEVLQSDVPVLVDFYATWCGPCKALAPIVEDLAVEYQGRAKIAKCDIEQAPNFSSSNAVMAVPTLIVFTGGAEASRLTGARPKPELEKALQAAL